MSTKEMVVDTTVLVASLVPHDEHHAKAEPLFEGLRLGEVIFHCPTFGPVETCGVLMTKEFGTLRLRLPLAAVKVAWDSLAKWIQEGKIKLYPLAEERMSHASLVAMRQRLKGPDAIVVQTALELNLPLETYDITMARACEKERTRRP